MAKNIVPKNPQTPQESLPPIVRQHLQAQRFQIGMETAHCWPRPGQTCPPNGFNSAEMRDEIISILHHIPNRYILIIFNVAIHLICYLDEPPDPPQPNNGDQQPPGEKDYPLC